MGIFSSSLIRATLRDDLIKVKKLLLLPKTDVNEVDKYLATSLMYAILRDNGEMVKLLLSNLKINVNKIGQSNFTALTLASFYNRETIIRILLERPEININQVGFDNKTALEYAYYLLHNNIRDCKNIIKLLEDRLYIESNSWQPETHNLYPTIIRQPILIILLIYQRRHNKLNRLPLELIYEVIQRIY